MQHVVQRLAWRRLECVAGVVRGGDEDALPYVGRYPEELRNFLLVAKVQRRPRGAQSPGASGELVTPRGRQLRSPESSLASGAQPRRADAGNDQHWHVTHVLTEIGDAVTYSFLNRAAFGIVGKQPSCGA